MSDLGWPPRPIRAPHFSYDDLGPRGWQTLHELAELRGRAPRDQILPLVLYALYCARRGRDVELRRAQLRSLQLPLPVPGDDPRLSPEGELVA